MGWALHSPPLKHKEQCPRTSRAVSDTLPAQTKAHPFQTRKSSVEFVVELGWAGQVKDNIVRTRMFCSPPLFFKLFLFFFPCVSMFAHSCGGQNKRFFKNNVAVNDDW